MMYQRIHPEDRDWTREYSERAIREGEDYAHDFRIVMPDGKVKHIHVLGHPVFTASGDFVEVVGTHVDVTEQKRVEQERERMRQLEAELAHINRVTTMGELTASLAHEVNQPITAAMTNANTCLRWLAGDTPNIDEAREAAKRIVKDANRAAEIISRIRWLFKKSAPEQEVVDLTEVINDIIVLLKNEAAEHKVSVRTELPEKYPRVIGDRIQLQQVLMNLIINSIDAMKRVEGRRDLTLRLQHHRANQLLISVIDNGAGLPPESDKIFDAFFTTKSQGTGMGLAISRSIIESHGGRLWATPNSGRGTVFYFTLPTETEDQP
jgi:signal transduction histidine kinase